MCRILLVASILALFGAIPTFASCIKTNSTQEGDGCPPFPGARICDKSVRGLHCKNLEDPSANLCIGDTVYISKCRQMTCMHYEGDVCLLRGCRDVTPEPGCKIVPGDSTKHYPHCCPTKVCDHEL